jgi:hypothetical protein
MDNQFTASIVTVLTAIIGVAIIAVLVSPNAKTGQVIQAGSQGFSTALGTALSPVTGSSNGFGSIGSFGGGVLQYN